MSRPKRPKLGGDVAVRGAGLVGGSLGIEGSGHGSISCCTQYLLVYAWRCGAGDFAAGLETPDTRLLRIFGKGACTKLAR